MILARTALLAQAFFLLSFILIHFFVLNQRPEMTKFEVLRRTLTLDARKLLLPLNIYSVHASLILDAHVYSEQAGTIILCHK